MINTQPEVVHIKSDVSVFLVLDIISPVYVRKPNLLNRLVLPLVWNFLSTTNSGVSQAGRANLQQAMSRICRILYRCLGNELIVEAESKGVRTAQKLEVMLQE